MKKLSIFILFIVFFGAINAQEPIVTWEGLKSQKEKTDKEILDPKKNKSSKLWAKRASVYLNIHTFVTAGLYKGMPASGDNFQNAENLIGKPAKKMTGDNEEIWEYNRKKLYFVNGVLDRWEQTEFIDKNAIEKSAEAYLKACDYDVKGKYKNKTSSKDLVALIKNNVINEGITAFTGKLFDNAYIYMQYGFELSKLPKNNSDTAFVNEQIEYFMGVIAFNGKKFEEAKTHFENCLKVKYNPGLSYHYLAESYGGLGDSTSYIETVKEGFNKHPDEEQLIIDLINFYLLRNQTDQAIEYIDVAIKKNPENPSYYSAKATVYDNSTDDMFEGFKKHMEEAYEFKKEAFRVRNNSKLKAAAEKKRDAEVDKALVLVKKIEEKLKLAEDLYEKSLEYDDKFFNAAYNIARIYLKRNERNALHADYILKYTMPKDFTKSSEYEALAKEQLKKSAEKYERALTLNPKDRDTLELLKRIYFRLRDKENQAIIDAKLDALGVKDENTIE